MSQKTQKVQAKKKTAQAVMFGNARGLVAMGTLAAYAVMGANRPAMAAVWKIDPSGNGASATLPLKRFDIAVGPLDAAIEAYEKATGLSVKIVLPNGTLAGFNSHGVTGLYREDEALRLLLNGTGLNYRAEDATTMVVGVQAKDTVSVTSAVPDSISMGKFTEPLLETAQSVSVVPTFVLQDEGVSTLRDTLRNVPGISLAAGEAGAQGDNLTIRGFTARNDIFLDGIRDFGSYYRDSFNYEQVEALEGPAGIQFGRGSTGGVINQESKVPQVDKFVHVDTQFGTDLTRRITADINSPIANELGGAAFRVNVMAQEGGVAGRDAAEIRRFGFAPSISIGMDTKTRTTLSYMHLSEDDTPDYGLPWLFNKLAPANRHSYFGFPDENYLKTSDDIMTLKVEHEFSPSLNLHTIARAANYPRQAQITEPQICSNAGLSVPVGGVVTSLPTLAYNSAITCPYTPNTPASEITQLNRNQIQVKSVEGDLWDQTEVVARFKTWKMRHDFVAGAEGGQEISNPIRYSYTINKINTVPETTLLNPNEDQPFGGTGYITSIVHTKSKSVGLYFLDTIKISKFFELSGGIRWDRFDTDYNLAAPTPPAGGTVTAAVAPISRLDEQPSYRAALVYKPSTHGSVYFDYGTSFNPDAESLSLSVGLVNGNVKPEENESYEGGAKWSFLNDRLLMEGAVFRTEKDNAHETDPTNSNNIVAAGNQLVKGAQFSVVGRLPEGMDLVAGYAYLDNKVIFSQYFPTSVGYPLANVPTQTFNLFVTHRLPLGLNGGVGSNYVGSRTASSTVPYVPTGYAVNPNGPGFVVTSVAMKQVPGYWIFNAMIKHPLTEKIEFQANVNNLLNRYYIDLPHPSHLVPGAGANAIIGVNFKF
ncbi:TonB-dependent siderophore receptor [Acidicapsa ligni]|uniref:TonB-dependent siderophore receptor n=1 Tax=Acidicapsa ligni TaxID=542300 RepID=UPI0021E0DD6A|nr:TonB-dependent siderophore receptor [Acidicapsa ligni]